MKPWAEMGQDAISKNELIVNDIAIIPKIFNIYVNSFFNNFGNN